MSRLLFDMEANGLYHQATQIWCIVTRDLDTGEIKEYYEETLRDGINNLAMADMLIGHNIIGYDIPVLHKLTDFRTTGELFDTLVVSRLLNPDRPLPRGMTKKAPHSVEAWGLRFGRHKPEHEDWSVFSPEMLHRCKEDTEIQYMIYKQLLREMDE